MESLVVIHHYDISASANMAASRGTLFMREIGGSRFLEPYITKRRDGGAGVGWLLMGYILHQLGAVWFHRKLNQNSLYCIFFLLEWISKDHTSLSPGSYMETLKSDKIQISGCFTKIAESSLEDKSEKGNIEALIWLVGYEIKRSFILFFYYFLCCFGFLSGIRLSRVKFEERPCKGDQLSYTLVTFSDSQGGTITKFYYLREREGFQESGHL